MKEEDRELWAVGNGEAEEKEGDRESRNGEIVLLLLFSGPSGFRNGEDETKGWKEDRLGARETRVQD